MFDALMDYPLLWSRFREGGPVMFVILGFSVLGLGLWLRVWLSLGRLRSRIAAPAQHAYLELLRQARLDSLRLRAESSGDLLGTVARRLLEFVSESNDELRHLARSESTAYYRPLLAHARWVLTCSRIAPLLGLLGTVLGISLAFNQVAHAGGVGDYEKLAGGIHVALYTTIFGLIVSLILFLLHQLLVGRIARHLSELEDYADEFILLLKRPGASS